MSKTKIVPDTSIIVDGKLTELIEKRELEDSIVIIPEAVVDELESQANKGREIGYTGIEEIQELQDLSEHNRYEVKFDGRRPTQEEIDLAGEGRVDAIIRDIAEDEGATLYTADRVQAKVARAKDIPYRYFEQEEEDVSFRLLEYFDDDTMSVHLKDGMVPKAKKGEPGNIDYVAIGDQELDYREMEQIAKETFEKAKSSHDGLVELNMDGATVVQIDSVRIAITKPPFSSRTEITAVRPVAKVELDDYEMSDRLRERLEEEAEGILIAGSPGHGKSTFAQALAEFYDEEGKVVKTMEHPRDLQVGPGITQYAALEEDMANTGDVLLLVRPDYTVFDEVRKTEDFEVFADMRLAGVGMIGVVHASEALDAVQRLIGRVELGVIPQVVDTVVFIKNTEVNKVYSLNLTVKVPAGMTEADLARPVIQIRDFENDEPVYEIYTYGEETVVIPVDETEQGDTTPTQRLARDQLEHRLRKWVKNPEIEFEAADRVTIYVDDDKIAGLIGKNGENIHEIEEELGINITVEPREEYAGSSGGSGDAHGEGSPTDFEIEEVGKSVAITVGQEYAGQQAEIYDGEEHLFTATVGKNGQVRLTKNSEVASKLLGAYTANRLTVYV
jgi:ATPase